MSERICPQCENPQVALEAIGFLDRVGHCSPCEQSLGRLHGRVSSIIKPAYPGQDFEKVMVEIIIRLQRLGYKVLFGQRIHMTREQVEQHYAKLRTRSFFKDMCDYLVSGPAYFLILEHDAPEGAAVRLKKDVGPTRLRDGKPGEIRHDFGDVDNDIDHHNVMHVADDRATSILDTARFVGRATCLKYFPTAS